MILILRLLKKVQLLCSRKNSGAKSRRVLNFKVVRRITIQRQRQMSNVNVRCLWGPKFSKTLKVPWKRTSQARQKGSNRILATLSTSDTTIKGLSGKAIFYKQRTRKRRAPTKYRHFVGSDKCRMYDHRLLFTMIGSNLLNRSCDVMWSLLKQTNRFRKLCHLEKSMHPPNPPGTAMP